MRVLIAPLMAMAESAGPASRARALAAAMVARGGRRRCAYRKTRSEMLALYCARSRSRPRGRVGGRNRVNQTLPKGAAEKAKGAAEKSWFIWYRAW